LRNPRLVIINIPEEISIGNVEEILLAQNTDVNLKQGDINAKFIYETRKHNRNLVMEVSAQTRKLLLHKKVKLGWQICQIQDYATNAPNSITELATAEERKPAPSAQEVTSLRNAQQILRNTNASTA